MPLVVVVGLEEAWKRLLGKWASPRVGRAPSLSCPLSCQGVGPDVNAVPCPEFLSPSHQAKCLAVCGYTNHRPRNLLHQPLAQLSQDPESQSCSIGNFRSFGWRVKGKALQSLEDCYLAPPGGFIWYCIKPMLALWMLRLMASSLYGW